MEARALSSYRARPDAIRALVENDRVHRDAYLSEEVFEPPPPPEPDDEGAEAPADT